MFSVAILSQQSQLWPLSSRNPPISSLSAQNHPLLSSHVRRRRRSPFSWPRYRRRYPIAGTFRTQNSSNFSSGDNDDDDDFGRKRRRWWTDNSWSEMDQGSGILEEFIDTVWIFKEYWGKASVYF